MKKDNKDLNEILKSSKRILRILLVLLIIGVIYLTIVLYNTLHIGNLLKSLLSILSPLFIGIILAWLFEPIINKLHDKKVNKKLASVFVFIMFLLLIVLIFILIIPTFREEINSLINSIPSFIKEITEDFNKFFGFIEGKTGMELTEVKESVYKYINSFALNISTSLPNSLINFITTIISGGAKIVFGIIIGLYMSFDFSETRKFIKSLIPSSHREDISKLVGRIDETLRNYIRGTLLVMLLLFILQAVLLGLIGLEAPLVFALFCVITDIIPYIGPWIGAIPVIIVGFLQGPVTGVLACVAVLLAQNIENYYLQPVVMGKTMKLHPVTIMLGLLIFEHFFGIIGMVLATPIISVLKVLLEYFENKYHFINKLQNN